MLLFRAMADIETIIEHLESDFRMKQKLSHWEKQNPNQCIDGCNSMEFEENDAKTQGEFFAFYFSAGFSANF